MTSYQKLRQENENLKKDIYNIIMKRDSELGIMTIMKYQIEFGSIDIVFFGNKDSDNNQFDGILSQIKNKV